MPALHGQRAGLGARGRRDGPGEWQNPTASPHSHNEDGGDETLLHARKGTLPQTLPGIFANATTASFCMQSPNPAKLFWSGVCTPEVCSLASANPHCCTEVLLLVIAAMIPEKKCFLLLGIAGG